MAKIIKIENGIVSIGTDNGGIDEARVSDLNFIPSIGDEVEVYKTESKTIVVKKDKPQSGNSSGININVQNTAATPSNSSYSNGKAVNKVAYCILAFFLGGIGAHKFYAGKIGMGILYLLFCWTFVPAVISLIEFLIGLTKRADENGMIIV